MSVIELLISDHKSVLAFVTHSSLLAHLSWKFKWAFLIICHLLSVWPFVRKLSTFSSFSPKLQGQFQPNLIKSILGWKRFKSGPSPRINTWKIMKIYWQPSKIFSRTTEPISTKLGKKAFWAKGIKPYNRGGGGQMGKLNAGVY